MTDGSTPGPTATRATSRRPLVGMGRAFYRVSGLATMIHAFGTSPRGAVAPVEAIA